MATIVLAAAGSAVGGAFGGTVLGLSGAVIGNAVGATVGHIIDRKLLGGGSDPVEVGRRDQFRISGSTEGTPIPRVWGQMRVSGQIIWSSRFLETATTTGGGGKGGPSRPETTEYSYSVSLALALCEGEITRVARIWADGQVIDPSDLDIRVYPGDDTQLPDPLIAASLPDGLAPAYRGTAYVVIENLELGSYGNRIPQLAFEVVRRPVKAEDDPISGTRAVALIPGTGEYSLATERVHFALGKGETKVTNVNNPARIPDAKLAIDNLVAELPNCGATSLIVSWFGSDLRCGECRVEPKIEQSELEGVEMPWRAGGIGRGQAQRVSYIEGRPGFGGTPADGSVLQAIAELKDRGQHVMFYPFILMDIRAGNGLPDPWGRAEQAPVPWRGRITTNAAPGQPGSTDKTAAAADEVAAFFGTVQASDFAAADGVISYSGPQEWSYRRFILHYAHLCALAGGVDSFCIGSELRSLTQIRDGAASFPVVAELRALAADVRAILGPEVKIGYAADWSEYFGYQPGDGSGDVYYHLDPLWADPAIDFIGIDNYMPLSDWRDSDDHADAAVGSIYDLDYLIGNVAGGEGYDWFYADAAARDGQVRSVISDGAYNAPWVYRYKDIENWWGRPHFNRPSGVRETQPTDWVPESKPIWFTELGCPAVDKGTNQPNVFVDPQSSENALPYYSTGGQDRYIQQRYLLAMQTYWNDPAHNPVSRRYDAPMVDMGRAFVWAWDARPWPYFPQRNAVWSDGPNHALGHWISGRTHMVPLADMVAEICDRAGLQAVDVSELAGLVQGYSVAGTETARESLQPLMLAYGLDVVEREGQVVFRNRDARPVRALDIDTLAIPREADVRYEVNRLPEAEVPGRVRVGFVHAQKDYQSVAAEAILPGADVHYASGSDLPVVLSHTEGEEIAARWLAESVVSRDRISLALPPSDMDLGPGDVFAIDLAGQEQLFRIDRVDEAGERRTEAVRVERDVYRRDPVVPELISADVEAGRMAPYVEFLDLPLLTGAEVEHAPWIAATHVPWGGPQTIYTAPQDYDYRAAGTITRSSVVGTTQSPLGAARPGLWSGQTVDVRLSHGALQSRNEIEVLNGANVCALRHGGAGDWEIVQFRDATLIDDRTYRLSGLLRGQAGTEPIIPETWPVGTDFVLLDGAAVQVDLPEDVIQLERHFRVGPSEKGYDDPLYTHLLATPRGVGLRPYAPVHLRAVRRGSGDVALGWIRRTRRGGDVWHTDAVPLAESAERYRVTVVVAGAEVRSAEVATPEYVYTAADQVSDGGTGAVTFEVQQLSDRFGAGLAGRIEFDG